MGTEKSACSTRLSERRQSRRPLNSIYAIIPTNIGRHTERSLVAHARSLVAKCINIHWEIVLLALAFTLSVRGVGECVCVSIRFSAPIQNNTYFNFFCARSQFKIRIGNSNSNCSLMQKVFR